MSILTYKYRIEPNKAQSAALADVLADFCRLYNACLEQRIDAWRRQISVGYTMQAAELKAVRRGMLAKHVADASWAQLTAMLAGVVH